GQGPERADPALVHPRQPQGGIQGTHARARGGSRVLHRRGRRSQQQHRLASRRAAGGWRAQVAPSRARGSCPLLSRSMAIELSLSDITLEVIGGGVLIALARVFDVSLSVLRQASIRASRRK